MRKRHMILAVLLGAGMAYTATVGAHSERHKPFSKMTTAQVAQHQERVISHDKWVIKTAAVHKPYVVWWHRQQLKWTQRELKETRARLTPPLSAMSSRTATWYGPGFYYQGTRCGQTMHEGAMWIAVDSMPCGTPITICYHGRCAHTSVQDGGGSFDMAAGLAKYLCGCSRPYTMTVNYRYG